MDDSSVQSEPNERDSAAELLGLYLACTTKQQSDEALAGLMTRYAAPIVERIVASKVKPEAREDVRNTVLLDLIERLDDLKRSGGWESIHDVLAYAAVAAFHACREHYRQSNPARHHLRRRLRYLLGRHPELGIWKSAGNIWLCGPKAMWPPQLAASRRLAPPLRAAARETARLVEILMAGRTSPLSFEELLEQLGQWTGVWSPASRNAHIPATKDPTIETMLTQRGRLQQLWKEILLLQPLQRASLLLSMRDSNGNSALALFPVLGIADLPEIADTLVMPLGRLSKLWHDLPLDDQAIGKHLGLDRQRVVNLRKAARERLTRRSGLLESDVGN